jgi:hypothetical protein
VSCVGFLQRELFSARRVGSDIRFVNEFGENAVTGTIARFAQFAGSVTIA